MAKQAGKFAPVFDLQDPQTASILGVGPNLAGFGSASNFGTGPVQMFQNLQKAIKDANIPESQVSSYLNAFGAINQQAQNADFMNWLKQSTEAQYDTKRMGEILKLQDEYDTKRGMKSLMFNQLGSGLNSLAKGIGMSMNPYGTPEAARYVADMAAQRGAAQAAGYSAVRTPMNLPIVQQASAPSYF